MERWPRAWGWALAALVSLGLWALIWPVLVLVGRVIVERLGA